MSLSRARRRALVLVPATALVGIWAHTVVVSSAPPGPATAVAPVAELVAPPTDPASVSEPESAVPTAALVRDVAVAHVGSPSDIPSLALVAYQRAASSGSLTPASQPSSKRPLYLSAHSVATWCGAGAAPGANEESRGEGGPRRAIMGTFVGGECGPGQG